MSAAPPAASPAGSTTRSAPPSPARSRGRWLFAGAVLLLAVVSLPVLLNGAPHLDDFARCLVPAEEGWSTYLDMGVDPSGIVRPAKFLEVGLLSALCQRVPFGLLVAVPLALTILVGAALIGLLEDLGVAAPWPQLAGVAWLLYPLGAESAWWPSALHIPLGLGLALLALRAVRRRRWAATTLLTLGAFLSLEQALFALPLAAAMVADADVRRRAAGLVGVLAVALIVAYGVAPGEESLAVVPLPERVASLFADPAWLLRFPAKTSGPAAVALVAWWWLPVTGVVVAVAALAGTRIGPWLLPPTAPRHGSAQRGLRVAMPLLALLAVVALLHLPMQSTVPRVESPRAFAPSWLAVAAVGGWLGSALPWRRRRLLGAVGVVAAALSLQTLAFQGLTRVTTANLEAQAALAIADRTADGQAVALCDVPVTLVHPALRWTPYAQHAYAAEHATRHAIRFYSQRRLDAVAVAARGDGCPERRTEADVRVPFAALMADEGRP